MDTVLKHIILLLLAVCAVHGQDNDHHMDMDMNATMMPMHSNDTDHVTPEPEPEAGHTTHNMGHVHDGDDKDMGEEHDMTETGSSAHHLQAFFFLSTEATILFEEWVASSTATFVGSCVAVGILAALYEGLKLVREILAVRERCIMMNNKESCTGSCTCLHLLQTFLHMVQVFISYCLMLVFMLFNGWLCLSIILGAGLGYNLLGWKKRYLQQAQTDFADDHCM